MPADRGGRASRACTACRKQKTRCYDSAAGKACLRCQRLDQPCSLDAREADDNESPVWQQDHGRDNDDRLGRLERTVESLVRRLDQLSSPPHPSSRAVLGQQSAAVQVGLAGNTAESGSAPLFILRDVATETGIQSPDQVIISTLGHRQPPDVVTKGLVSQENADALSALFLEHYGRWVSFSPTLTSNVLLAHLRGSALLLCSCLLIAVRHTTQDLASTLAPALFKEAKDLISTELLRVPQSFEFFQASLILSMWSTTIGRVPLSIDSWLLSGFALQHSQACNVFDPPSTSTSPRAHTKQELDRWCVWNHLCLVHLHYCVGTRRKAILEREQVDRCRLILGSDHATNFETRMVAEIYLYWIIYESCSSAPIELPKTQEALQVWKQEWNFLFHQPRSQFIQMGFHFAQLLVYEQSLKTRSAAVRESLLSEMVRLSMRIINLAMETTDDRTRHLTDHIYHMISFAAVSLCRTLSSYETQLASSYNIHELDALILSLVSWLHAIGLPCHVAHTMGDVVAAFHQKLRPNSGPSPSASYVGVDPSIQDDFAQYFPELFGPSADFGNGVTFSNWGSII